MTTAAPYIGNLVERAVRQRLAQLGPAATLSPIDPDIARGDATPTGSAQTSWE